MSAFATLVLVIAAAAVWFGLLRPALKSRPPGDGGSGVDYVGSDGGDRHDHGADAGHGSDGGGDDGGGGDGGGE